ncbi:MAG: hypothetical protein ABJG78_08140 [Cyclobacteriaceae bacterium]
MFAGLQIQINALNAIIPDSFIFVLDCTDRSFLYKSSDSKEAIDEILALDQSKGIDNLFDSSEYYDSESALHTYMIKRLSSHTFLGFFVLKEKFSELRIKNAKEFFLKIKSSSD